jgi:hypothetical protein
MSFCEWTAPEEPKAKPSASMRVGGFAVLLPQQLRQFRYVRRDPPRLVFARQLAADRRPDRRFGSASKIETAKGLPVGVADDKAGGLFFDAPRRREAASSHGFQGARAACLVMSILMLWPIVDPTANPWVVEVVDPMASSWVVEVAIGTTGSAARHRMFAARWETVLRHRQRSTSDQQRSHDRKAL